MSAAPPEKGFFWTDPLPPEGIAQRLEREKRERDESVGRIATARIIALNEKPAPAKQSLPLEFPPGKAGDIARFIYHAAPRPVPEVAIAATLGLLAGICGKSHNVSMPPVGLNAYIMLVGRSATGKEAMHSGINLVMKSLVKGETASQFHKALQHVTYDGFASGPALIKACAQNPCMVSVTGEWGKKINEMADAGNKSSSPMYSLRTVLTNLYEKSGRISVAGGTNYSNRDDNVASVEGVALSIVGETTPGTFFQALTEEMICDGFLSRITIIENSNEKRPERNRNPVLEPDAATLNHFKTVVWYSMERERDPLQIEPDPAAIEAMTAFEEECDRAIDAAGADEGKRVLWNRSYMKMLRTAGVLAVADKPEFPVISVAHVEWSIELVRRSIEAIRRRQDHGDIGVDDHSREGKLKKVIAEILVTAQKNEIYEHMRSLSIVPRSLIQQRVSRVTAFSTHRLGSNKALDESLRNLESIGFLMEVERTRAFDQFGSKAQCYRVLGMD